MNTKMVTIPFDLSLAKKISSGECTGNIITEKGELVRIVCWDAKGSTLDVDWPLVALIETNDDMEMLMRYPINGRYNTTYGLNLKQDLFLRVPEELLKKTKIEEDSKPQNNLFNPFDKVLVRQSQADYWECAFFSNYTGEKHQYRCQGMNYMYCIPYNEETAHLIDTTDNWDE